MYDPCHACHACHAFRNPVVFNDFCRDKIFYPLSRSVTLSRFSPDPLTPCHGHDSAYRDSRDRP